MSEMKVLLALLARHYSFTADNNTEWVHTISKVPKVGLRGFTVAVVLPCAQGVKCDLKKNSSANVLGRRASANIIGQ